MSFKRKNLFIWTAVAVAVIAAYLCRMTEVAPPLFAFMRAMIYIALFIVWGLSIQYRIRQKQARRYLLAADFLILFWISVRTLKYLLVTGVVMTRYLWYLYYIPMLLIPMLGVMLAWSLNRPDDYRLPPQIAILWTAAVILIGLVLTNDLHGLVFIFPQEQTFHEWSDDVYDYGIGYFVVLAWEILCAISSIVIMALKCRIPGIRKYFWLPPLPLLLSLIYTVLYFTGVPWLRAVLGDLTVTQCLLIAATFEACIGCGLIQSNTHYWELFTASVGCNAMITDPNFNVYCAAREAEKFAPETLRMTENSPLNLGNGRSLHTMPIRGGYAAWVEDNSGLLRLKEELEILKDELKERNEILRQEYEQEKASREVEEQNRLYDMLQRATQQQIDKIASLAQNYRREEGEADSEIRKTEQRKILAETAVLCTYIKRRKHMALLAFRKYDIAAAELRLAMEESLRSLELLGAGSALYIRTEEMLPAEIAIGIYAFFEDVIETAMESLEAFDARIVTREGKVNGGTGSTTGTGGTESTGREIRISMSVSCRENLQPLREHYPEAEISCEGGEWQLVLRMKMGGGAQ